MFITIYKHAHTHTYIYIYITIYINTSLVKILLNIKGIPIRCDPTQLAKLVCLVTLVICAINQKQYLLELYTN